MYKYLVFITLLGLGLVARAIDPSQVKISVYAVAVSTSADCSNPIVVVDNGNTAVEVDFTSSPNLGNANISNGTYPCVILKMSDVIKFTPAASSGSCNSSTEYTIDVCRAGAGTFTAMNISGASATYGASANCTGSSGTPADDQVSLFLSTNSSVTSGGGGGGSAFDRPTSAGSSDGFQLSGALTVSGSGSGTFVVNFNGAVNGSGGSCDLNPPVFGFR